jgi:hypothetical protein
LTLINESIILNKAAIPRSETVHPLAFVDRPRFILNEDPIAMRE